MKSAESPRDRQNLSFDKSYQNGVGDIVSKIQIAESPRGQFANVSDYFSISLLSIEMKSISPMFSFFRIKT